MSQSTVDIKRIKDRDTALALDTLATTYEASPASPAVLVESGAASKIASMSAAAALDGTEKLPLVQSAGNVYDTVDHVASYTQLKLKPVHTVSDTSYTLLATDNGKILVFTAATAVTVTINTSVISAGFKCDIVDDVTSGAVTFSAAGGVTLLNRQSHTATAGIGAVATLIGIGTNSVVLGGDTA